MGKRIFLLLILICIFVFGCVSKEKYVALESDLMNTQEQVQQGDESIKSLEQRLSDCSNAKNTLIGRLEQANEDMDELERRLGQGKEENALCQKNLTATEEKLYELQDRYNSLEDELKMSKSVIQEQKSQIYQSNQAKKSLEMSLKDQIASQQIKLNEMEGKLKVTFIDKILFDSGSSRVNKKGQEILEKMASSLKQLDDQNISVEGHTDDVPIGALLKERYPTNWDLSTARSVAVVRYLTEMAGMNPELFSAVGYGENHPIASNETEEGRSQNRRIEIVLVPIR